MERLTKRRKDGHADPAKFTQFIGQEMDDKLADYEDAEEEGRLIEFPVAIGDHLWCIPSEHADPKNITEMTVTTLEHDAQGDFIYLHTSPDGCIPVCFNREQLDRLAFFSREEAEAKLKEMEDNNAENHETE